MEGGRGAEPTPCPTGLPDGPARRARCGKAARARPIDLVWQQGWGCDSSPRTHSGGPVWAVCVCVDQFGNSKQIGHRPTRPGAAPIAWGKIDANLAKQSEQFGIPELPLAHLP